jgi:hypothetical protein
MAENSDSIEGNCQSLENLHLYNELEKCTSASGEQAAPRSETPKLILCDSWYGFPSQKRPRKERICAVSRQLVNFLEWRLGFEPNFPPHANRCQIHLLGSGVDVEAIRDRMQDIAAEQSAPGKYDSEIIYKSNLDIHEAIQQWKNNINNTDVEPVYLSPDASESLSVLSRPPPVVIVGMLIDRRITSDRSRKRAEDTLNLRAVKLPLNELNVKEMCSEEPLNVDTVMELMQRWWFNCDKLETDLPLRDDDAGDIKHDLAANQYKKCFVKAAAWAMKSHRDRHPNRPIHL